MNTFLPSQSGLTSAEEREGRTRGMTGLQSKGEFYGNDQGFEERECGSNV